MTPGRGKGAEMDRGKTLWGSGEGPWLGGRRLCDPGQVSLAGPQFPLL